MRWLLTAVLYSTALWPAAAWPQQKSPADPWLAKPVDDLTFQTYLDFFKYGCPPHGGYGMGPARMMMKLLGTENVREVTFLHRGVKRLTP